MINKIEQIKQQESQLNTANQQLKNDLEKTTKYLERLQNKQQTLSQLLSKLSQIFMLSNPNSM
jgi:DNA-binding protein H-NS